MTEFCYKFIALRND